MEVFRTNQFSLSAIDELPAQQYDKVRYHLRYLMLKVKHWQKVVKLEKQKEVYYKDG
jgi:hypothetical protein